MFFFYLKMLSAYYVCYIFSKALQNSLTMEANVMNPDQTAPQDYCLQPRLSKYISWGQFHQRVYDVFLS